MNQTFYSQKKKEKPVVNNQATTYKQMERGRRVGVQIFKRVETDIALGCMGGTGGDFQFAPKYVILAPSPQKNYKLADEIQNINVLSLLPCCLKNNYNNLWIITKKN